MTRWVTEVGERLTPREMDVLRRISRGHENKEIARELGISPRTVEIHRGRAILKMGAKNAAHAVANAIRGGII